MTALRRLDAPTGRQPGDHACWTSAGAAEASAAGLPSLDAERRLDEQLRLIGASRPELLRTLALLPGRGELFGPSAGKTMPA